MKRICLAIAVLCLFIAAGGYTIVQSFPHDPTSYTQGLVYQDGYLWEGTGREGKSVLRQIELETGKVVQQKNLPSAYFGEGIVLWKDKIIQLTWQSRIGFVYDRATFRQLRTFTYSREGWGITHDGKRLIMSDGSSTLYFWDPETFKEIGHLDVDDRGNPVSQLNELEFIKGEIFANIWQTERIARISPTTGHVLGWIDLSGLRSKVDPATAEVLNGIAYDSKKNRLLVTGKLWSRLFEIKVR